MHLNADEFECHCGEIIDVEIVRIGTYHFVRHCAPSCTRTDADIEQDYENEIEARSERNFASFCERESQ